VNELGGLVFAFQHFGGLVDYVSHEGVVVVVILDFVANVEARDDGLEQL